MVFCFCEYHTSVSMVKLFLLKLLRKKIPQKQLDFVYSKCLIWIYKSFAYQLMCRLNPNNRIILKNKKTIFLLGTPIYGNLGDQAIAYAELKFLKDKFPEYDFVEITDGELYKKLSWLKMSIRKDDIIVLIGGGNMGETYIFQEETRQTIINKMKKNKIIIFPQTIDYGSSKYARHVLNKSRRIYSKHRKLVIVAREAISYNKMKKIYLGANVILTPDIVLYLKYAHKEVERQGILLCLRSDIERKMTDSEQTYIKRFVVQKGLSVIETDTVVKENISVSEREKYLFNKWDQFEKSKLVITDRLHGMVFSVITETPCIVFKNTNHKIEGVYQWIKHLNYIRLVSDIREFEAAYNTVVNAEVKNTASYHELEKKFIPLIKEIKSGEL